MRKSLILFVTMAAACGTAPNLPVDTGSPALEQSPVAAAEDPLASSEIPGGEASSASPVDTLVEEDPVADLEQNSKAEASGTEFNPDGLSVGPGSGFVVLTDPAVVPGAEATWLSPDELVLGVLVGDTARAYPISQMAYHHIANDQIAGEPYLVTY